MKDNNKMKVYLVIIVLLTFGSFYFIKISNDHKECTTEQLFTQDKNDNQVVTEKHTCNEKYNF